MVKKLTVMERMLKKSTNPYASRVLDNVISESKFYHNTGNHMFNLQVSGKIFGGLPSGKIIELSGDSGTAKSYLIANIIYYSLQNPKNFVILYETEGAQVKDNLEEVITDDMNERYLVENVSFHEDLAKYTSEKIEEIKAIKGEEGDNINFLVFVDSLGMLSPKKAYENVLKGKETKVMNEPQLIKSYFNMIKMVFAANQVSFMYTNHIYDDYMNAGFGHVAEVDKKKTRGGQGTEYCPDIKIRLMKKVLREETHDENNAMVKSTAQKDADKKGSMKGIKVVSVPTKSRIHAAKISKAEFDLRFQIGMDEFSGILEFLERHKLIEKVAGGSKGSKITIPGIGFEMYSKEISTLKKEEFYTKELLLYVEKMYNEFYALKTKRNGSMSDDIDKD